MRAVSLLPLAVAAVVLAGCAAETPSKRETATPGAGESSIPERDLTLRSPATPAVAVASPVELSRPAPKVLPTRRIVSRRPAKPATVPAPVRAPAPAVEAPAPAPAVALTAVAAEAAPVEEVAVGAGRELAPGKTVTVIPASSGPS